MILLKSAQGTGQKCMQDFFLQHFFSLRDRSCYWPKGNFRVVICSSRKRPICGLYVLPQCIRTLMCVSMCVYFNRTKKQKLYTTSTSSFAAITTRTVISAMCDVRRLPSFRTLPPLTPTSTASVGRFQQKESSERGRDWHGIGMSL